MGNDNHKVDMWNRAATQNIREDKVSERSGDQVIKWGIRTISVYIHPKGVIMGRIPAVEVRGIAVLRGTAVSPSTVRKAQCLVLMEKEKHRKVLNEGCSAPSTCSRRRGKKRCPSCSKLGGQEFLGRKLKAREIYVVSKSCSIEDKGQKLSVTEIHHSFFWQQRILRWSSLKIRCWSGKLWCFLRIQQTQKWR